MPVEPSGQDDIWMRGEAYERYMGRWSRRVAAVFIDWLAAPAGGRWLDAGCGTGELTAAILERAGPAAVVGVDPSEGFLALARERVADPRARFLAGDARALPAAAASVDAVVGGLMLNFVPEPAAAVSDMARVTVPGGVVAVYVWDYTGGMELIRHFWDAAGALDPAVVELDQGERFGDVCSEAGLERLWFGAGLGKIETRAIEIETRFRDFDDYWQPFLGGQGPAPAYATALDPERRDALRERLRASLPFAADGSIALTARAWAVRGVR